MMFSQSQDHKTEMEQIFILNINVKNPLTSLILVVILIALSARMITSFIVEWEYHYVFFIVKEAMSNTIHW